ncbi:MAG: glycosyltransferase [bacterium]|nr:glycosyltransferase [bacterium]
MKKFIIKRLPELIEQQEIPFLTRNLKFLLSEYISLNQKSSLSRETREKIIDYLVKHKVYERYIRKLNSIRTADRITAASILSHLALPVVENMLIKAFVKEKKYVVKMYIANALVDTGSQNSISIITESVVGSPHWYQERIRILILQLAFNFNKSIPALISRKETEIHLLIIYFASNYRSELLKSYLIKQVENSDKVIREPSVDAVLKLYSNTLTKEEYVNSEDNYIKAAAIKAMGYIYTRDNIKSLINYLKDPEKEEHSINALTNILCNNPKYLPLIKTYFDDEQDPALRKSIAKILANRIEYFLIQLLSENNKNIQSLIKEILLLGQTSTTIGFLNRNQNIDLENEIIIIIKDIIKESSGLKELLLTYLNERLVNKIGYSKVSHRVDKKEELQSKSKQIVLYTSLLIVISVFPLIHIFRYADIIKTMSLIDHSKLYIINFNYHLIFYSIIFNSSFLMLLFFSFLGKNKQKKLWEIKNITTLFKKKMVPSISVIAPAYNEEATIIESTNSLLNLKYPDYEIIVVNDGSLDSTLNNLLEYFDLERIDRVIDHKIDTMPVRGIYINERIPKLIVIDKVNGGKADSLNVGINVSGKDYFCGMDSDSLLESDSLLKAVSPIIDSDIEGIASGGNILPVNSCRVDNGYLEEVHLSKKHLVRLQSIEYLRAFMGGRIGWAYLNSLLIISGAFGVFKKDRVIEVGGYLTEKGIYNKNTVGEDMELVVRLSRYMSTRYLPFKIYYSYNANCWTEVPENLKILLKQRDRWQRGLIDILIFHKGILFQKNPGTTGLIAMPYYYIFEFFGPLIEVQGYIMVLLSFIFGLLNIKVALLLFISTILMGMMISICSLIISDEITKNFKARELIILIAYSLIENFGFRQLMSILRVMGYFNSLKKKNVWGQMIRKGFASEN